MSVPGPKFSFASANAVRGGSPDLTIVSMKFGDEIEEKTFGDKTLFQLSSHH